MSESLDARARGDIYWRKLKRYLASANRKRARTHATESEKSIAMEILELRNSEQREAIKASGRMLTGNEFLVRPPTATGDLTIKNNVLRVMDYSDRIKADLADNSDTDKFRISQLSRLDKVIDRVLHTWFLSVGLELSTGSPVSAEEKKKAISQLEDDIGAYNLAVKTYFGELSKNMIRSLAEKLDPEFHEADDFQKNALEELILAYPDKVAACEKELAKLKKEYNTILGVREKMHVNLHAVSEKIKEMKEDEDREHKIGSITYTEAYGTYLAYADEQNRALHWSVNGCLAYARYLLTGEVTDPMVANYIKWHYGKDVPTISQFSKVRSMPDFVGVDEIEADLQAEPINTDKDALRVLREIWDFKNENPEMYECQTITSLLFKKNNLFLVAGKARTLRNYMFLKIQDSSFLSLELSQRLEYEESFIFADTMARVSYFIMEYKKYAEEKTLNELMSTYFNDADEMSFSVQESRSREALHALLALR